MDGRSWYVDLAVHCLAVLSTPDHCSFSGISALDTGNPGAVATVPGFATQQSLGPVDHDFVSTAAAR